MRPTTGNWPFTSCQSQNCQMAYKPGSVPALDPRADAEDGHSSGMPVTGHLARPTRMAAWKRAWPEGLPPLLGLAPGGVCLAASVTGGAVRSCRPVSPLPAPVSGPAGGLISVALSLGSPPPGVTRHRVSVEPGLSSSRLREPKGGHPAIWQPTSMLAARSGQAAAAIWTKRPAHYA